MCILLLDHIDDHTFKKMCVSVLGQVKEVYSFRLEKHGQEKNQWRLEDLYRETQTCMS